MRNIRVARPEPPARVPRIRRPDPLRDWIASIPILALPIIILWALTRTSADVPRLVPQPEAAAPGVKIAVEGTGFAKGERGVLTWDGVPSASTYRANGKGAFSVALLVPADAALGTHAVAAVQVPKPRGKSVVSASTGAVRSTATVEVVLRSTTNTPPGATASPTPSSLATASLSLSPSASPSATSASASPPGSAIATPLPTDEPSEISEPTSGPCPASLQSLIDSAASGSTLAVPACTYRESVRIPKPLTLVTKGGKVDGEGIRTYGFVVAANDVTIDGFEITRTTNPAQDGAVRSRDVDRFTLRNAHIHHTGGACVSVARGSGHRIVDSELAYCAQEGFHITGVADMVVARNRIHHNNPNAQFDTGWEAGGGKATAVRGLVFEGNQSWSNIGPGLWCDIDCRSVVFRNNRVWGNSEAGIFFEISNGALIEGNQAWENGWRHTGWGWGAGILVSSSRNVEIRRNVVAWNADGVSIISQNRSGWTDVINISVHHNDIVLGPRTWDPSDKFLLGWLQDHAGVMYNAASNNSGHSNRYWHSQPEPTWARFDWAGPKSRLSDFNATPGESDGRYLTNSEKDAVLGNYALPLNPS